MSSILHYGGDSADAPSVIEGLDIVGIQGEATIAEEPGEGGENNFGYVGTTESSGYFDSGAEGASADAVGDLNTAETTPEASTAFDEAPVELEIFGEAHVPGGIAETSEFGGDDLATDDYDDFTGETTPDFEMF